MMFASPHFDLFLWLPDFGRIIGDVIHGLSVIDLEVGWISVCWADPEAEALARWTTFPRDSILGCVWFTSVDASASRGEDGVIMFLAAVDKSVRIKHLFTSSETVEELGEGRHDC